MDAAADGPSPIVAGQVPDDRGSAEETGSQMAGPALGEAFRSGGFQAPEDGPGPGFEATTSAPHRPGRGGPVRREVGLPEYDGRMVDRMPILVADQHRMFATALRMALRARGVSAYELAVDDSAAIVHGASRFSSGLVLLDLALRGGPPGPPPDPDAPPPSDADPRTGELVRTLLTQGKQVIALTELALEAATSTAVVAGAVGVLDKTVSFEGLLDTLDRASVGAQVMSDEERRSWRERHRRHRDRLQATAKRLRRLSPHERVVLDHLSQGRRATEIAALHSVSLPTVRTQIRSILAKLEVSGQLEAVALLIADRRRIDGQSICPRRDACRPGSE
jgi:DNA-binding NarL/FixJ family response regulator